MAELKHAKSDEEVVAGAAGAISLAQVHAQLGESVELQNIKWPEKFRVKTPPE
jgi:hypothetical protein